MADPATFLASNSVLGTLFTSDSSLFIQWWKDKYFWDFIIISSGNQQELVLSRSYGSRGQLSPETLSSLHRWLFVASLNSNIHRQDQRDCKYTHLCLPLCAPVIFGEYLQRWRGVFNLPSWQHHWVHHVFFMMIMFLPANEIMLVSSRCIK